MDRFYVDERAGCIAIRDKYNTDQEYKGLHPDTQGVVWFQMGVRVNGHWDVPPTLVEQANERCELYNLKWLIITS